MYNDFITTSKVTINGVKIGTLYFNEYEGTYYVCTECDSYDYYEDRNEEYFD